MLSVRKPRSPRRRPSTDSLLSTYSFHNDADAAAAAATSNDRKKRFGVFLRGSGRSHDALREADVSPFGSESSPTPSDSDSVVELRSPKTITPEPDKPSTRSPLALDTTPEMAVQDLDTGAMLLVPALKKLTASERASMRSVRYNHRGSRPTILPAGRLRKTGDVGSDRASRHDVYLVLIP